MSDLTTPATMGFLERATRDPSIDVAKLEQLIALQERVLDREAKRQFAEAMNALQREMPQVTKDALSQNRRYATYEAVDRVIRPHYTQHGFSVSFTTHAQNGRIRVGCKVKHIGGHEETEHELESGPDMIGSRGQANKTEVQGVGSVTTYLKRYTLMAAFAVALQDDDEDDDGEGRRRVPDYSEREAINADVPLTPPPAAPKAPPAARTDKQWTAWLQKLRAACDVLRSRAEVEQVGARGTVGDALAEGPVWVQTEISSILADAYKRVAAADELPLDEVAIAGEEKVGAG